MNCREPGTNPDDWFAVAGSERYLRAKRACYECPLLAPCREYALEEGVPYGIWGGLSKEEREAIWEETGGKPTKFRDDLRRSNRASVADQTRGGKVSMIDEYYPDEYYPDEYYPDEYYPVETYE